MNKKTLKTYGERTGHQSGGAPAAGHGGDHAH